MNKTISVIPILKRLLFEDDKIAVSHESRKINLRKKLLR